MDMNNRNNPEYNNNYMNENETINNNEEDMYSINRYDYDRFDNRFDNRYDNRNDNRNDRRFDRRYDRRYDNYYRYPYCDRYGRCDNNLWWLFWPFFFF